MQVLVVEDDPTAADLMRTRLRNLGCQPLIALDAEDGLRLALSENPMLILLDLKLNENVTSGLELLHRLRSDERTANIPVFIHSIFVARRGDLPEAEALADGFLLKPFKLDDLRRLIEGFMAGQATDSSRD